MDLKTIIEISDKYGGYGILLVLLGYMAFNYYKHINVEISELRKEVKEIRIQKEIEIKEIREAKDKEFKELLEATKELAKQSINAINNFTEAIRDALIYKG